MKTQDLIESFSEFKEFKSIDRERLMRILEEVFRAALAKRYGTDDNFNIIVNIDKAPCQYEVILPFEKIEYDGEAHGATVIVPEGSGDVTIIYENAISGERTTEEPVEPGLYDVYIIITEGEYYYGIDETNVGQFEITAPETAVEELSTSTMDNGAWYTIDGRRVAAPTNGVYIHNGKKYVIVK